MHGPLRESDVLPNGPLRRLGSRVILLDEVDSTNAYLLRAAGTLPDGAVTAAEYQHDGHGRHGRKWIAPRGSSLLLSVLFLTREATRPARPLATLVPGTLEVDATALAAVAACEAVEATTDCRPELRWPNDVLAGGRKLGGVLAEVRGLSDGRRALVLGIGLNCLQQAGHFRGELTEKATSLELLSAAPINRGRLAGEVVTRLDDWAARLVDSTDGSAQLRAAWRRRCMDVGRRVSLQHDAHEHSGTIVDIAENGDLDVQLDVGGRRRFDAATTTRCW